MSSRNWFSNFIPYKINLVEDGIIYATPEHYYQAHKSMDSFERMRIAKLDTPGQAKRAGRKIAQIRPDWHQVKWIVMYRALLWRIETDPEFVALLLETGDTEIVELNTWHDNYWGCCQCSRCFNHKSKNLLGKMLMSIRAMLMSS